MSKSPKNYRKNHIMLRLTDDEYQTVKMRAENAQIALAVYARNCVLNRKMTIKKQREISGKYLNQIAWIGNNINQLAKVINIIKLIGSGLTYRETANALQCSQATIRRALKWQNKN